MSVPEATTTCETSCPGSRYGRRDAIGSVFDLCAPRWEPCQPILNSCELAFGIFLFQPQRHSLLSHPASTLPYLSTPASKAPWQAEHGLHQDAQQPSSTSPFPDSSASIPLDEGICYPPKFELQLGMIPMDRVQLTDWAVYQFALRLLPSPHTLVRPTTPVTQSIPHPTGCLKAKTNTSSFTEALWRHATYASGQDTSRHVGPMSPSAPWDRCVHCAAAGVWFPSRQANSTRDRPASFPAAV